MRRFADSYFWLAFLNPKDAGHELASEWMDRIQTGIVTTEWVLLEVADAMSHPKNRSAVVDFIGALRVDEGIEIVGSKRKFTRTVLPFSLLDRTRNGQ